MNKKTFCLICLLCSSPLLAEVSSIQKEANESFSRSKRLLLTEVHKNNRKTLYCQIAFDEKGTLIIPDWFDVSKVSDRSNRVEIEHIVPAEKFGAYIRQWWQGDPLCVNKNNEPFKGRRCADKTSRIYRLMQADMYNLYPVVGSLNTIRAQYDFGEFPDYVPSLYKKCKIKVSDGQIEVSDEAKGIVARAYLYFNAQYPFFELTPKEILLYQKWNSLFPVTKEECLRTYQIEQLQFNENQVVKSQCIQKKLWPFVIKEEK